MPDPAASTEVPPRSAEPSNAPGCFVAVVGPSGAGKDTLISIAAARLASDPGFGFPRRIVTRRAQENAEDHLCMTQEEFAAAERAGGFCLTWSAHGLRYGLPTEISAHLTAGRTVVANVSRSTLQDAADRFARLHVVEICAPEHLLAQRIVARGRETVEDARRRLHRQVVLRLPPRALGLHRVRNEGPIAESAAAFLAVLNSIRTTAAMVPTVSAIRR